MHNLEILPAKSPFSARSGHFHSATSNGSFKHFLQNVEQFLLLTI
jgi:hypothetical protein